MKKFFLSIALCAATLVSCNKAVDQSADPVMDLNGAQVVFRMAEPETRGTGVDIVSSLSSFNAVATTGTTSQTSVWTDGVFSGTSGGNYTGGKYWPSESVTWNFYASNAEINFAASGSTITVSDCETDIVAEYVEGVTKPTSAASAATALTFDHILAQLGTVTMKAPATYTVTGLKVSLLPIYTGTYNIKSNTWTRGDAVAEANRVYVLGTASAGVNISNAGGSITSEDNDLWLLPGSYALKAEYTLNKGDFHQAYTKQATVSLVQGKNNNLGLPGDNHDEPNIPDAGSDIIDIIFTVSITAWADELVPANFK